MSMKWIVALACGSALALGACSSTPTPATTPDPGTGTPTDPGTPDPDPDPDEDTRTDAEKAFDTALGTAQAELAKVAGLVADARTAAASTGTAAERTAATAAIKAATDTLAEAVRLANALTPPEGDATRRGHKVIAVNAATAAQTAQGTVLTGFSQAVAAAGSWAAGAAGYPRYDYTVPETATVTISPLAVDRRNRNTVSAPGRTVAQQTSDGDAAATNLLKSTTFPAVQYADGKYVLAQGQSSGGDKLRMHGMNVAFKHATTGAEMAGTGETGATLSSEFEDEDYIAGMRITRTGLQVEIGGAWMSGLDMVRDLELDRAIYESGSQPADNEGWDLSLTFGAPSPSPDGNGDFYWTAPLYIDETQKSQAPQTDGGVSYRANKLGDYQIWLSNFASVDYGNENDVDPGGRTAVIRGPVPGDDEVEYLQYAAYGAMTFAPASGFGSEGTPSDRSQHGRIHVFNVGYDAFKDENGKKTTDLAAAERITPTSGKFVGTTTGFTTRGIDTDNTLDFVDVAGAKRIRGDVELTATIGATTASNTISGTIKGVQYWDVTRNSGRGGWTTYGLLGSDGINLHSAPIADDGTFESAAGNSVANAQAGVTDAATTDRFEPGRWKGAFYGPTDALEVAGTWYMLTEATTAAATGAAPAITPATTATDEGLVGSFGAKYEAAPATSTE